MAFLHSSVYDSGLAAGLQNKAASLDVDCHLCSAEPASFVEAETTYSLGSEAELSVAGPSASGSGRKVTVAAVTDASVAASGTATHIALVDTNTSTLLAVVALSAGVVVASGELWSANAWDITFTAPTD